MQPIDWTQPTVSILNQLLEIVERRRPTIEAWAGNAKGFDVFGAGPTGWSEMLAKLRHLGYTDVADTLLTGLDFGNPQMQTMLTHLSMIEPEVFSVERVSIMKDWGVERRPRWTYEGFTAQPTIEDVDRRKGLIGVKTKWEGVAAVIDDKIHRGLITDWQQVVDIVAGD